MVEWMVKLVKLAEMTKLIALMKDFAKFYFYLETITGLFERNGKKWKADFGIWWLVLYGIIKKNIGKC